MNILTKIKNRLSVRTFKENSLAKRNVNKQEILVAVPDIKEYLVKEYERSNNLKLIIEGMEQKLEKAKETEIKYDAAMVTLDELTRRFELAENETEKWKMREQNARQAMKTANDEVNSYKIKLNSAAITKEELTEEIVEEVKAEFILLLSKHKGNLSKKAVCEIISTYRRE